MSTISVDYDVLNQKGSPAWFSDTFANIPTFGYKGRMFISIDTFAFYRDTGTGWDLIGGPGIGTLTGSGTTGQVSFFNGTQVLTGNNNLFWDNTNSRLGINTATPGQALDVHSTANTLVQLNNTTTADSVIAFQNQNVTKWKIGNLYNAGANSFDITNPNLAITPFTISSAGAITLASNVTTTGAQLVQNGLYVSNANAGAQALYTTIYGRNDGINFGLRNSTGGAGFIFQSANSYDYTFPATAGTIALTSNLSSYLPLAGGTLTGALIGTSATFSGNLTIDTNTLFVDSTNNRVGIKTGTPDSDLQVAGNCKIDSTLTSVAEIVLGGSGSYPTGGTGFRNDGTNLNIYLGSNACLFKNTSNVLGVTITQDARIRFNYTTSNVEISAYDNDTLQVKTNLTNSGRLRVENLGTGLVYSNGAILTSTNPSDERLKNNIQNIKFGLSDILKLRPVSYYWKNDEINQGIQYGFLAQEVKDIMPELIKEFKTKEDNIEVIRLGLEKDGIYTALVKAIQELNEKLVRNNIN